MKHSIPLHLSCLFAVCLLTQTTLAATSKKTEPRTRQRVSIVKEIDDWAGPVSTLRPNAVSVEALGRGLVYGIAYDRALSGSFAVGLAYSTMSIKTPGVDISWRVIPLYMNYYFSPDRHRVFLTGSLHHVAVDASFYDPDMTQHEITGGYAVTPTNAKGSFLFAGVGGGYEFRAASGFLFRLSLYQFLQTSATQTWGGLTLGATF